MSECVHDFVSMRIAATVDMCQLCGVPEPAYTIAKLKAELVALRKLAQALVSWPDSSSAQAELAIALWAAEEAEVKDD